MPDCKTAFAEMASVGLTANLWFGANSEAAHWLRDVIITERSNERTAFGHCPLHRGEFQ